MEKQELIDKWELKLKTLKNGIAVAGEREDRFTISLLYPKMELVTEFVEDLKKLS